MKVYEKSKELVDRLINDNAIRSETSSGAFWLKLPDSHALSHLAFVDPSKQIVQMKGIKYKLAKADLTRLINRYPDPKVVRVELLGFTYEGTHSGFIWIKAHDYRNNFMSIAADVIARDILDEKRHSQSHLTHDGHKVILIVRLPDSLNRFYMYCDLPHGDNWHVPVEKFKDDCLTAARKIVRRIKKERKIKR